MLDLEATEQLTHDNRVSHLVNELFATQDLPCSHQELSQNLAAFLDAGSKKRDSKVASKAVARGPRTETDLTSANDQSYERKF